MAELTGKVAIVTGASSGIGRAVAIAYARAGLRVALAARRAEELAEVERACREAGGEALAAPTDVADRASVDALVRRTLERFGGLDILVAAAGVNVRQRGFAESRPADWERIMAVNVLGAYHAAQAALEPMRARGGGLMILIGSLAAKQQNTVSGAAYTASKHALAGMALSLAAEEQRHGIRVTVVHPGLVNTPILDQRPNPPGAEARQRAIQPEDLAETCLYLARLPARVTVMELTIVPTIQG